MNTLPYLAGLAMRHAWAEREYAKLHADIAEARLTARVRSMDRAARTRAEIRDRISGIGPARRPRPAVHCARASAHAAGMVRVAGGAR